MNKILEVGLKMAVAATGIVVADKIKSKIKKETKKEAK
jgi:hypothetical protein